MAAKGTKQAKEPLASAPTMPPDTSSGADDLAEFDASAPLWHGNHASPTAVIHLVRGNLRHGWRLLLAAGLGMLVAVVLLCTVPLYSTLVGNIQLQSAVSAHGPNGRNIEVVVTDRPTFGFDPNNPQPDPLTTLRDKTTQEDGLVRHLGQQYLGAFTDPAIAAMDATAVVPFALINDQPAVSPPDEAQAQLLAYDYSQAGPHMSLLAGHFPQPLAAGSSDPPEALITLDLAHQRNVRIGDTLSVAEPGVSSQLITVRVVGVWQPNQADDNFWNGRGFNTVPLDLANGQLFIYPILLDPADMQAIAATAPSLGTERHWIFYTDTTRVTTDNMNQVANDVLGFEHDVDNQLPYLSTDGAPPQVHILTQLDTALASVATQLTLLTQPLFVVAVQLEGLALLFVGAMAGLLIEAQAGEIATLRSRGASGWQVQGGYALQGGVLGLVALVVGPWLAAVVAVALVRSFVPAAVLDASGNGGGFLTGLAQPRAVLGPALAGAALGVGAVIVATWQAARMDVLTFRREEGRSTRRPFWRRFYLDIALAVICVLGYIDLSAFGGLGARTSLGQTDSSPFLFATPALLLLAGGLLVLRVFPIAAGLGARIAARARGAVGMLAFSQIARSAAGPMRLALLLALGVGLGIFALTFTASLAHNGTDRAAYQTGADVRVVVAQTLAGGDATRIQSDLTALPGAPGVTPVYRGSAQLTLNQGGPPVGILAIDPTTWPQVAGATSWRGDYAATSLSTLMDTLAAHQWPAGTAGQTTATGVSSLGDADHPVAALISASFAAGQRVQVGQTFQLSLSNALADQTVFDAVGIIQEFPTYYPAQSPAGLIVVGIGDLEGVRGSPEFGPNEFWLRAPASTAQRAAFDTALAQEAPNINAILTVDRPQVQSGITDSPLQTGMRGLLAAGVVLAVVLALLGSFVQAALSARKRAVQFAVLRSLGMQNRQLSQLLLGEQAVVYLFGLVGGTLLGVVLATATLPYLQFNDAALDPTTVGVPADRLIVEPLTFAWFYAALVVAFIVGLIITARAAARVGLGKTLRLGED